MNIKERYWLRVSGLAWQECTKEQFIRAERGAGFRSKFGENSLATGGFSNGSVQGRVTNGDNAKLRAVYAELDPEFMKVLYD